MRPLPPQFPSGLRMTCFLILLLVSSADSMAQGETPRVLPEGQRPNDMRLKPLKDLNGYFPFEPAKSPAEWEKRANQVRRRMLVSLGLWPLPTKTPLNAVIHGKIDQGDYTVERAYFESMPGFYVTGSLYRPKNAKGKVPAVLCPHGHWSNGRFYDAGEATARQQVGVGAEKFDESAHSPLQARCVHLARMGCVVFHYDMIGYADCQQISYEVAHRFAKQRPEMNRAENWGLFSPQAESHVQSVMGLQSWNSIRALDFVQSLDQVDPERIGVTGASGGGTQTFVVSALDPRVKVSMPCVMVSTAMQGGCTCENCSLLRVGTGNVEFAALFAPKPLGLTAANDWTKQMSTKGFPQLQQHYKMLGYPDNVMLVDRTEFKHNYNAVSRAAMYRLMNQHLGLGLSKEQLTERDFKRLSRDEMTVWNDKHPQPEGGPDFERKLLRWWHQDSNRQLADLLPTDKTSLGHYRQVVGGAVDALIGRRLPKATQVDYEQLDKVDQGDYLRMAGLLRHQPATVSMEDANDAGEVPHEELPIVFLFPKQWEGTAVIWIDEQGKSGLFQKDGSPKAAVMRLLRGGASVVGVDLFEQGEFRADGKPLEATRRVKSTPRQFAGYSFGFNHTVFAKRVHDVLSVVTFVRNHAYEPENVHLVGLSGSSGALVACARVQAGSAIERAAIATNAFRFGKIDDFHSPNFLPGGAKYLDLPGILSLSQPDKLWVAGETVSSLSAAQATYKSDSKPTELMIAKPKQAETEAVDWLLQED